MTLSGEKIIKPSLPEARRDSYSYIFSFVFSLLVRIALLLIYSHGQKLTLEENLKGLSRFCVTARGYSLTSKPKLTHSLKCAPKKNKKALYIRYRAILSLFGLYVLILLL